MDAKVPAEFFVGGAETCRASRTSEATHRIIALFDRPMVLFDAIVEIMIGKTDNGEAQNSLNRLWQGCALGRSSARCRRRPA